MIHDNSNKRPDSHQLPRKLAKLTVLVTLVVTGFLCYMNFMSDNAGIESLMSNANIKGFSKDTSVSTVTKSLGTNTNANLPGVGNIMPGDNSLIARAAVTYSYITTDASHNNGTQEYRTLHDTFWPGDNLYMSCDRSAACAVWWSGADIGCAWTGTRTQMPYFAKSKKWDLVPGWAPNETFGSVGDMSVLQPGDILISCDHSEGLCTLSNGVKSSRIWHHIVVYVGYDIVKEIKGEDACKKAGYKPGDYLIAHGSYGDRSPAIGKPYDKIYKFNAFRCNNKNYDTKYQNLCGGIK